MFLFYFLSRNWGQMYTNNPIGSFKIDIQEDEQNINPQPGSIIQRVSATLDYLTEN